MQAQVMTGIRGEGSGQEQGGSHPRVLAGKPRKLQSRPSGKVAIQTTYLFSHIVTYILERMCKLNRKNWNNTKKIARIVNKRILERFYFWCLKEIYIQKIYTSLLFSISKCYVKNNVCDQNSLNVQQVSLFNQQDCGRVENVRCSTIP